MTLSARNGIVLSAYTGGVINLNTDTVKEYLSIDGEFKQTEFIRKFCENNHEFQDCQNTLFSWSDSGKNSKYTVCFADNCSFDDPYIITADKNTLKNEVGIFVPGKTYYWFVRGNDTDECSMIDSFTVEDTPVRFITSGKVINMRDEGGYMTLDGGRVKYGLVYRGGSLDEDVSYVDDTAREVFRYLKMKSEIELRGESEHRTTGWDENNLNVYWIKAAAYESIFDIESDVRMQYRAAFEGLADENNYPFYFHCLGGADRSGAFGYLLNGLLGVPYKDLRKDYELTSFSVTNLRPADSFNDTSFDAMHRMMIERYGKKPGDLQDSIRSFLTDFIGLSNECIEKIRRIMIAY